MGRRRGAGAEVREDLIDHRRLRDEGDDPHRAVAGRAREGVDFKDLLQERRPPAAGLGGRECRAAGTIGGGTAVAVDSALPRIPRGRLAYQP